MTEINNFKAAIKASGMTLQDACDLAGITKPTMIQRQDDPLHFRLYELKSLYLGMSAVGKGILLDAINEIFLDETLRNTQ